MRECLVLETRPGAEYELLDSGEGEKLERYGMYVLSRPDPQALWPKRLGKATWEKRQGRFVQGERGGRWEIAPGKPDEWEIGLGGLRFWIRPTSFKHTGVFPEQVPNWEWMGKIIEPRLRQSSGGHGRTLNILNLFGYTGGATLACLKAGAAVTHVDASKVAVSWAKRNAEASGVADRPVRWILDDARSFVRREVKRGKRYDGIIMDPPAFGRGAKGELWKIEEHLPELFALCREVLSPDPLFFLVNGYAAGYSAIAYENNLAHVMKGFDGEIEIGELAIRESGADGRLLPAGIFARWHR